MATDYQTQESVNLQAEKLAGFFRDVVDGFTPPDRDPSVGRGPRD